MIKVSVIMPTYNSEKTIKKSIESVLNQTYRNLEIIIINDGSTDSTEKIIKEYSKIDSRIIYIYQENGGVSSARNTGLNRTTGEYIAFIDADDLYDENMVEILVNYAKDYDSDIVSCSYIKIHGTAKIPEKTFLNEGFYNKSKLINFVYPKIIMDENLMNTIPLNIVTKIFKRNIIDMYKIRFNTQLSYGEDLLFCKEFLLYANSFYYLPKKILYKYVNTSSSATNTFINDNKESLLTTLNSQNVLVKNFSEYKLDNQIAYFQFKIAVSRIVNIIKYMRGTKKEINNKVKLILNNNQISKAIKLVNPNKFSLSRRAAYELINRGRIDFIYFLNRLICILYFIIRFSRKIKQSLFHRCKK